jgi:hypothetical protein
MTSFVLNAEQRRWARNRAKAYRLKTSYVEGLIRQQRGCCAWSGVELIFDASSGTSVRGGVGPHPRFAALDHSSPGSDQAGHQIVCFDLNDAKGHLPFSCFEELRQCPSWHALMGKWFRQATVDPNDRFGFRSILRQSV